MKYLTLLAVALFAVQVVLTAQAMSGKDTRYDIATELRTVRDRSTVALNLMLECNNQLPLCDPTEDEKIVISVDSVEQHAKEAKRLLDRYK